MISLGTIKHIEINEFIAYVLYEHYFSALLANNILNELIAREKKNLITIKLFTKEEDEEKQKKARGSNGCTTNLNEMSKSNTPNKYENDEVNTK